jgi:pyruvate dehydrogenase E2 component (dihydrolipoamide acetyltransferase)
MTSLEYTLADVGEGIDAAELIEWHVGVGDAVREDQPLVDVQTDKAVVVIPCPADGVIAELRHEPGDSVAVGSVLAVIQLADAGERSPAQAVPATPVPSVGSPPTAAAVVAVPATNNGSVAAGITLASPAIRRLAREQGIDLASLTGTGAHGRIRREDVQLAVADATTSADKEDDGARLTRTSPPTAGETSSVVPLRGVRRAIARNMSAAWQTVPHIIDYREADMGLLIKLRDQLRARAHARDDDRLASALTITALLAKITVCALAEHPDINASVDMEREQIIRHGHCHLGIATSTVGGLLVPVIRHAESLRVGELATAIVDLSTAARDRRLPAAAMTGATFTLNNFGALGIWLGTPLIVPPQVANFGIGRVTQRAVVRDGEIIAAPIAGLSVSGDHRVLDGHTLAAFVTRVVELIEAPALLIEELR